MSLSTVSSSDHILVPHQTAPAALSKIFLIFTEIFSSLKYFPIQLGPPEEDGHLPGEFSCLCLFSPHDPLVSLSLVGDPAV